jgi:phage gpG-like protein
MIDIQIEGKLPSINPDLAPAMVRIADRMYTDVLGEFNSSGYGRWEATRDGKPSMLGGRGGAIASSITKESDATSATVSAMNTIHQRGGPMVVTDKMRSFFWAKWYETKDEKYKWMALNRNGVMSFPTRTYLTFLDTFFDFAKQELNKQIFTTSESVTEIKSTENWSNSR